MTTLTGQTIGGYLVQEELGRGGMGVVFKAQQLSIDRPVAIKFLNAQKAEDEKSVARFLREARAAGKLAHPNVVSVYDAGRAEGLHYIVMELVEGPSAQQHIREKGHFSEDETLNISAQIAEALRFAHGRGVLHRDVKPDNFLIDARGHVRLADLGLARFVSGSGSTELTQDGSTLGTPRFMSPEQCKGSGVDARSDLYSLGASMFMMATGKPPFDGPGPGAIIARVLTEPPAPIREANPDLSPAFVALVEKLLNKDPSRRCASADELLAAIERCRSERSRTAAAAVAPAPARPRGVRWKPALIGGACAILFLIVLGNANRNRQDQAAPPAPTGAETKASSTPPSDDKRESEAQELFNKVQHESNPGKRREYVNKLATEYFNTQFYQHHMEEIQRIDDATPSSGK